MYMESIPAAPREREKNTKAKDTAEKRNIRKKQSR